MRRDIASSKGLKRHITLEGSGSLSWKEKYCIKVRVSLPCVGNVCQHMRFVHMKPNSAFSMRDPGRLGPCSVTLWLVRLLLGGLTVIAGMSFSTESYQCFHSLSFKPKQLVYNIHSSGKDILPPSSFLLFCNKQQSFKDTFYINMLKTF